jgi:hypothetical protein
VVLLAVICIQFSGCGYTTRSLVTDSYRTIYVPAFANKIEIALDGKEGNKYRLYRPFLESEVTQSVIDKFMADGSLRPAVEEESDLVLKGEITEFVKDPLRYDKNDNVLEYRVNIAVRMSLWDRRENQKLWEENRFIGNTTYFATGSTNTSEQAAVDFAVDDLSRRIVERVVEAW